MTKRRTDQEWKNLFEQYESSQLSQRVFCERHSCQRTIKFDRKRAFSSDS